MDRVIACAAHENDFKVRMALMFDESSRLVLAVEDGAVGDGESLLGSRECIRTSRLALLASDAVVRLF